MCVECGAWNGCLGNEQLHDCERPFLEIVDNISEKDLEYVLSELRMLGIME